MAIDYISSQPAQYFRPGSLFNIHMGALQILPTVSVTREYSDNFFPRDFTIKENTAGELVTKKVKTSESALRIRPAFELFLPMRDDFLSLRYMLESLRMQDLTVYNSNTHSITAQIKWNLIAGLSTEINESFMTGSYLPQRTFEELRYCHKNEARLKVMYELGRRYMVEMEFEKYLIRYHNDIFQIDNHDDNILTTSILYQIMPKIFFGFQYTYDRYWRNDLPDQQDSDSTTENYWFTIQFNDPDGRLMGSFQGGPTIVEYDDPALNTGNNFFGFTADLTFKKSRYTTIKFSGQRFQANTGLATEDAVYGASFKNTRLQIGLTHRFTYKISGTINFSYTELIFDSEGAFGTIGGIIEKTNFSRQDHQYKGDLEINYQMKEWLGIKVRFAYTDNNSNVYIEDFTKKTINSEININF